MYHRVDVDLDEKIFWSAGSDGVAGGPVEDIDCDGPVVRQVVADLVLGSSAIISTISWMM